MGVTVYQFEHSPYCIPITRTLEALGVAFDVQNVSNADRGEIIRLTDGRYYQVPVLVHDGTVVFESSPVSNDVAHYVNAAFANGRLFPAEHEGLQRLVIAHLENEVEGVTFRLVDPPYLRGIMDPTERVMIVRHKERKFGVGCVEEWAARRAELSSDAQSQFEPYDLTLRHSPFLFGETPLYADFALFGVLGNLTYRDYNPLPKELDALGFWFARMKTFRFA